MPFVSLEHQVMILELSRDSMKSTYTRAREDPRKAYGRKGERENVVQLGREGGGGKLKYTWFYKTISFK
jgi:hypothetical protein